jgi:hypothetical protein
VLLIFITHGSASSSDLLQVYGVSVDRIYAVESSAFPSYSEMQKLPNKVLLWCGMYLYSVL